MSANEAHISRNRARHGYPRALVLAWIRWIRLAGNVLFFALVAMPLLAALLVGLYYMKVALGVDLIPDLHLGHLFGH